jgi:hypothetical protein
MRRRATATADLLRRLAAGSMAVLVFALTLLAVSPAAHDLLHDQDAPQGDDRCAVVLFASGVDQPPGPIEVPLPPLAWAITAPESAAQIFLSSPRYLLQPERGPPALG